MSSKSTAKKVFGGIGKVFLFIITFVVILAITLFIMMKIICLGSTSTRNTFITTVLETGQLKFLASLCLSEEEIAEVVASNSLKDMSGADVNEGMITVPVFGDNVTEGSSDSVTEQVSEDIEIIDIPGLSYKATLMIVKDPSRVSLAAINTGFDEWPEQGITLQQIVEQEGAIGAINGGLYNSTNNSGGNPYGVCVSKGVIVRNKPQEAPGLVLVGLTESNILQIIDLSDMSAAECEAMIKEKGIRDAVCFQEAASVDNNHFVHLVINGEPREITGNGSGLNPRTAIGQRADGALLLLVTDGRGYNNHAGASAADLIEIMVRYGAVNAANLDGGSSTCMYYEGEYLQNSVTFYYSQSSWKLPCAFVLH